jgi:SAM-dependent methyltransferase
MPLVTPARPDALRPTVEAALSAWAARVRADRAQVDRLREASDPADFYAPVADRFRADPRRTDDDVLHVLGTLARPNDRWLDIGAGGGRYALALALLVREVACVEPSEGMRAVLAAGMEEHGITNIHVHEGYWPPPGWPAMGAWRRDPVDVSLMAHVGYDIEAIGPFLDAMEAATSRLCVAVMGEGAMTTAASLFWAPIHGEPRVPLPALPELLALLLARGRLPEVRVVERVAPVFDSFDDLAMMARRQLWVAPGSAKDARLVELLRHEATERDGRWTLDRASARIGVVTWAPEADGGDPRSRDDPSVSPGRPRRGPGGPPASSG